LDSVFKENGFLIVRNVLATSELNCIRSILKDHFETQWLCEGLGKHQPDPISTIDGLEWLAHHPKIIQALATTMENDTVYFANNSDAHMNMLSWWHKDTAEGMGGCLPAATYSTDHCKLCRVGIYLQDHEENGLAVRVKSHHTKDLQFGKRQTLATSAGDIIIFDMRLTHAGQFADPVEYLLLRTGRFFRCENLAMKLKSIYCRIMRKPEKLSVFLTYAIPSAEADYFEGFMAARKNSLSGTI
jgi:hypothetical protein